MRPEERAEVLPTHTPELFEVAVQRAVRVLRSGGVVALPTETVYGLAANALDPAAVARLFEIKGRPAHNPVIVHVSSVEMARRCARQWPAAAEKLAGAFWPGPLTLVLPRADGIPDQVTAGGDTVGVRWPRHAFIQAAIHECGFPLAAPSANLSTRLSPTNAEHVRQALGDRIQLIVDGGQTEVGIESTVVDLTTHPAHVLRPGMIHELSLLAVLGEGNVAARDCGKDGLLKSPGQLKRHYSPKARLVVLKWRDDEDLKSQISNLKLQAARCHVIAHLQIPSAHGFGAVNLLPHDAEAYARGLYSALHRCDEAGAEWILAESLPDEPRWQPIADRLRRASVG